MALTAARVWAAVFLGGFPFGGNPVVFAPLDRLLPTFLDALAVGSLYALIALGYTMVYGILKFINFAHSDVFVLGAWISLAAATTAGWPADQTGPVALWVWISLGAVMTAGGAVWAWGKFGKGVGAPGGFEPGRAGPTMVLAATWGGALVALFYVAKFMKTSPALAPFGGGVILLIAMGGCGLVGFVLERLAYKPLRKAPRLNVLITAIGVSLLLQNTGQLNWMFGTRPDRMPTLIPSDTPIAEVANAKIWPVDVMAGGTAVLLMVLLDRLVFATKLGRAMRAVSFSERNAALMGVSVDRVISFTFVLGASLAAAAGFLYAQKYPGLQQTAAPVWVLLGLKAFVAAVVGGIGNVRGAMLGGLMIGLLEFFGVAYARDLVALVGIENFPGEQLRDVYVFAALILVLLFRPGGMLGRVTAEKV
ncbi:High-affinity branched-chain amino acid transport system permease protein LivH [Phycisphaerales bacterium]|nr:High-affinity branched-chain amino acid transport system permease protein LivH [Phycisphaerales bacterium]